MKDKISLAGDLGSGKSTVSKILIPRLSAEYYSTGAIVRSIAEKRGMSVVELNVYMEDHPEIDHEIDDGLRELGGVDKTLVIDSRMAWHFTPGTFKVYLSTDIETSALRIMNANRVGEHSSTLEDTVADTRARRLSEQKRYMTQYGVDIKDLSNYSLVVDTTNATPEEVAECIIEAFGEWQKDRSYKRTFISPMRLKYPDEAPDSSEIASLSDLIDEGREIPEVEVVELEGDFYAVGGACSALAYSFSGRALVPATLVKREVNTSDYVTMKDSI